MPQPHRGPYHRAPRRRIDHRPAAHRGPKARGRTRPPRPPLQATAFGRIGPTPSLTVRRVVARSQMSHSALLRRMLGLATAMLTTDRQPIAGPGVDPRLLGDVYAMILAPSRSPTRATRSTCSCPARATRSARTSSSRRSRCRRGRPRGICSRPTACPRPGRRRKRPTPQPPQRPCSRTRCCRQSAARPSRCTRSAATTDHAATATGRAGGTSSRCSRSGHRAPQPVSTRPRSPRSRSCSHVDID